jgi:hypothetical protein
LSRNVGKNYRYIQHIRYSRHLL